MPWDNFVLNWLCINKADLTWLGLTLAAGLASEASAEASETVKIQMKNTKKSSTCSVNGWVGFWWTGGIKTVLTSLKIFFSYSTFTSFAFTASEFSDELNCASCFGGSQRKDGLSVFPGPVSQLGISQLWLDQMVLPYVSLSFPQLPFCHLFTYPHDRFLSRTEGGKKITLSLRNVGFIRTNTTHSRKGGPMQHMRNDALFIFVRCLLIFQFILACHVCRCC